MERTTIEKSLEQLVCGEEGGLQTANGGATSVRPTQVTFFPSSSFVFPLDRYCFGFVVFKYGGT